MRGSKGQQAADCVGVRALARAVFPSGLPRVRTPDKSGVMHSASKLAHSQTREVSGLTPLSHQVVHDEAVDIGEPEVAALITVGQLRVVHAHQP